MKPLVALAASDTPAAASPSRPRPVTGRFAKQLSLAVAPSALPAAPADEPPRAPARGLVGIASRAQAAKQAAVQPLMPQLALPPVTIDAPAIQPLPVALPIAIDISAPTAAPTAAPSRSAPTATTPPPENVPATTDAPIAIAATAADPDPTPPARTPLEQAVHDLLAQIGDDTKHASAPSEAAAQAAAENRLAQNAQPAPVTAPAPAHAAAPAAPVAQPEAQAMQSAHHAHIVLGDDANRVVMTVAVRGANVNVTLKTADEHTAAALARNAGSLDEAMRHRGLDLDSFEAEHEAPREREREQPERQRREPESTEPFELEESV